EAGTGNVVEATRHMRQITGDIRRLGTLRDEELFAAAKELQAPHELVVEVAAAGKLPVVLFTAGGIATPADAAMMMQLGADGVFVASGIFKSGDPAARAAAIVKATTFHDDPDVVAKGSRGLGEPMGGISTDTLPAAERSASRGWCPGRRPGRPPTRPGRARTRLTGRVSVQRKRAFLAGCDELAGWPGRATSMGTAGECTQTRHLLGVYLLGAIDPAGRAAVDRHLAQCAECRHELAGLAGLPAMLGRVPAAEVSLPGEPGPPAAAATGGLARLAGRGARPRRARRWCGLVLATVAVVLAAMLGAGVQ